MRKPSPPQPTASRAGRALTAREAAFGRPTATPPVATVRKSTLHTVRPTKGAASERAAAATTGRSSAPAGGRLPLTSPRTSPSADAAVNRTADTRVATLTVVPKVVTDQRVVVGLVLGFLACVLVMLSINVTSNLRSDSTRLEMTDTFRSVHTQQQMFRMLNSRFATWTELKATGAGLPVSQSVRASKADSSHWFLSLVDARGNMICDRTGELWDESPEDRAPVCRKLTQ